MPNTGKPSLNCNLCRIRRVKCDLTRPACIRCTNYGVVCPGYREQSELVFRHANVASLQKRTGARKKRVPDQRSPAGSSSPCSSNSSVIDLCENGGPPLSLQAVAIPAQINESGKARAIARTLVRFCAAVIDSTASGLLGFLPELIIECGDRECLLLTADLFSTAFLVVQQQTTKAASGYAVAMGDVTEGLRSKQLQLYGRALRSVNQTLTMPDESAQDFTIMAVWLLGHYEVLVHLPSSGENVVPPGKWSVHMHGLMSLLRLRGAKQLSTPRGRSIFWTMFSFVQVRCLIDNVPLPPEAATWLETLSQDLTGHERVLYDVSCYVLTITGMMQRLVTPLLRGRDKIGDPDGEMTRVVPSMLADLAVSEAARPAIFMDQDEPPAPPSLGPRAFADKANLYWAARMKLHNAVAQISTHVLQCCGEDPYSHADGCPVVAAYGPQLLQQIPTSLRVVRAMGQAVLNNMARRYQGHHKHRNGELAGQEEFPDCWAEGVRVLWPLAMTSRLSTLLEEQRQVARTELARIGERLGIAGLFSGYAVAPYQPSPQRGPGSPMVLPPGVSRKRKDDAT